jgi:hypothetical protein
MPGHLAECARIKGVGPGEGHREDGGAACRRRREVSGTLAIEPKLAGLTLLASAIPGNGFRLPRIAGDPDPEIVLMQFSSLCDTFGIHVAGDDTIGPAK